MGNANAEFFRGLLWEERMTMQMTVARLSGFCPGVKQALRLAEAALKKQTGPVYTIGPLIHNPQEVNRLQAMGLRILPDRPEELKRLNLKGSSVILRSHGASPALRQLLESKKANVVDATCAMVRSTQESAVKLAEEGYELIIVGSPDHPEVQAIQAYAGKAVVTEDAEELQRWMKERGRSRGKVGVIAQTTVDRASLQEIIDLLLPQAREMKIYNTICKATATRQREAARLARQVDLMLVVGGRNSSNTSHLRAVSESFGTPTRHIETAAELDAAWFAGARRVGVIGGASTPDWITDEIVAEIARLTSA